MILSCSSICKSFGSDDILKNASFHIEEHEKAAVVGINGAGKSTLLKIITGELPADSGEVVISKGKTLGYLAQDGWRAEYITWDLHASGFAPNVVTEHEEMFTREGIPIKFLIARPEG